MQPSPDPDQTLSSVATLGVLRAPRRFEIDGASALEGGVDIGGKEVTLRVELRPPFPLGLPRLVLVPWDALGMIPHVDGRGEICFTANEGLIVDRQRPVAIIVEAVQGAVRVLTDGVRGVNAGDFADEFEAYWAQLPEILHANSVFDLDEHAVELVIASGKDQELWVVHDAADLSRFKNGAAVNRLTLQRAIYLPLSPSKPIPPPRPDRPFWTAAEARSLLLPAIPDEHLKRVTVRLAMTRVRVREYVLVSLPRPSGGVSLFGLRFDQPGERHPLLDGRNAAKIRPVLVSRMDRKYLVQRGGGDLLLEGKRILIAGCGAVGGHLAFELARAGVLDLTLVDPDCLLPENSFRHVLGRTFWNKKKVAALKGAIELQLPYVQVRAVPQTIEAAIAQGHIDLASFDLVVLALGNPAVELEINTRLHVLKDGPPAVITWLEPLGIGGHAMLTGNGSTGGCFACLYTSPSDGEFALDNRAAFAAPGQSFSRSLAGCDSVHTPYGSMDAVRTASGAARLAIDALLGRESGNPLVSWKGDAAIFHEAGFAVSDRYALSADELDRQRNGYRVDSCAVCGRQSAA